jgi:hypothetical protein
MDRLAAGSHRACPAPAISRFGILPIRGLGNAWPGSRFLFLLPGPLVVFEFHEQSQFVLLG